MMRLYRASDALLAQRAAIEAHLFEQVADLFGLPQTVTLYDLTNTFFEGEAAAQPKAERGHSKEKRSDCPLLTLGLVLDGAGFVRRSEVFAGAVNEDTTLAPMLDALHAPADALVVMDAGSHRGQCRLAARERLPLSGRQPGTRPPLRPGPRLPSRPGRARRHVHKVVGGEVRLYCYSEARAPGQRASRVSCTTAQAPAHPSGSSGSGSAGPCRGALPSASGKKARAVTWDRRHLTHPGVYCRAPTSGTTFGALIRSRCLARSRTRPAPHLPPDPEALRRAPVHHRDRLPAGADHPPAPRRAGGARKLGQPATHSKASSASRNLPARSRHVGAPTTGRRRRPRSRRHRSASGTGNRNVVPYAEFLLPNALINNRLRNGLLNLG